MLRSGSELLLENATLGRYLPVPAPPASREVSARQSGLSPTLSAILREVQQEIGHRFSRSDSKERALPENESVALIHGVAQRLGLELSAVERDEVLAQLEREQRPFGILQGLVDDPEVSDIIVTDHARISIQQGRRNFHTDLAFPNDLAYESYVEKLLQRANTTYSTKKPIADGMIGSFARIHAVHRALCESGPYLTIRLNRFASVEIMDLFRAGLGPLEVLKYLSVVAKIGQTLLIVGEVGTGKTTLTRAIASSLPIDEAILVIEDTPEIRLKHPHVRYVTTREANSDGVGRVTPSECIRGGMRMAMNRIIFGEIRDSEAAEAFIDVCASGHPGISTIHARSAQEAVTRLELFLGRAQRGVSRQVLNEQIATAVQVIVFVDICRQTGRRRVMDVREIGPVADGVIRQREIFRYQPQNGSASWRVVNRVSAYRAELEEQESGVFLSTLSNTLELNPEISFKEASNARR